jgi:flagellar hook-length control protein FliK
MAVGATNAASARGEQQSTSSGQGSFSSSGGFSPASEKSPVRKGEIDLLKGRPLTAFEQQIAAASTGPRPETIAPVSMTGHVVQGAMARERLSSQSLAGLSESIRGAQVQGGGNIKIRLNPDHLGEIRLEVATVGNRVGLKIQASDAKAKNVIEESIKYLRESLGTHDLNLAKVDVSVAPARANTESAFSMDQRGNESGAWNAYQQQSDLRQGGRQAYGSREDSAPWSDRGSLRGLTQAQQGAAPARSASVGRVDVMA